MSNYWEKRAARQMHNQMQKAEDYARDLAQYYIAASRHLQSEQNAILRRFALTHHMTIKEAEELVSRLKDPSSIKELIKALKKNPGNAEIIRELEAQSARARIMRLNALQDQVTYTTGQIQILLNKKAQKLFVNLARSAYYNTMFDAMQRAGYGFNVKMLDPKRIKRVMDRSWAGSGFSKRLWGNTKALEDAVKREIMVNLLTGRPPIKASQAIDEEFGKGYNNARRLIRTESAYITNQMTLEGYKDLEAEKYIYVAILDLKTSKVCRSLDKKRFLVKNAKTGVNYPPMHPWCRSTTIPWMPDHLLKNMKQRALDPKTGKHVLVPGDMTYEQWYKQFVQDEKALKISSPSSTKSMKRSLDSIRQGKAGLDKRRQGLLSRLPSSGDYIKLDKDTISTRDLAYLSAATGNEFSLFRGKKHDVLIRGTPRSCDVVGDLADEIETKGYEWIAHSHVDGGPLVASLDDRNTLQKLHQKKSIIVGPDGVEAEFGESIFD